jgi:protoporphyrinogen oxidase
MTQTGIPVGILGAGPAGLGAAYRLSRRGKFEVTVIDRSPAVGGNAGSFELAGLRADYGSHRLHPSCNPEILADIRGMLGEELLDRPRHGRIRLRGRWVHFPLKPADLLRRLPPSFLGGVAVDTLAKPFRRNGSDTFAAHLERGLGRTICRDFYFPYARKIWGVSPDELDAEQARRRVSAASLGKLVRKALNSVVGFRKGGGGRFYYPQRGFGAISEAYAAAAEANGACLKLKTDVTGLQTNAGRVRAIETMAQGSCQRIDVEHVFSTIPISQLIRFIRPTAPQEVLQAACNLKFRAMILIYLVLETEQFTEFDAHYFPDGNIGISRLSEPKNYGLATNPQRTVLCAELPCSTEDPFWRASDRELGWIVRDALRIAGLPVGCPVLSVTSRKLPQAYPIYDRGYRDRFDRMDDYLQKFENLVTFGRQGLFAHDNTHHALAMAYALDGCLNDSAVLDRERWAECRREFQNHVVED